MANKVWKINPDTKDLSFTDSGMLETLEDDAASAQGVAMTLGAWKGDFDLVPGHGTDYEQILGVPADEETIDEVFREAIFQEDNVSTVDELGVVQAADRSLAVTWSGRLSNGEPVSMEVNVGE